MYKNKNKQQNNNSQKIVVQEFDYDKLAEAIVKAQEKSETKSKIMISQNGPVKVSKWTPRKLKK